eukprot:CAMPEP_0196807660 /NCGR_PEP_ID=MMETSP1362-20130617/7659_1 /TAXON_ID=163516 /ORGANISM="Leptocylindrus danicus, Strain CCMP1856" /LENGTH=381 /DNA_ID=CAMNT_0042181671 /DNA_START=280 /DNA_END=1425 /DNA_ORIENTATION=-
MTRVKIELLESEGFCWEYENKREKKWHEMYAELREYKKKNGHCNVPKKCRANQKLGSWVDYQRTLYRQTIIKNASACSSNKGTTTTTTTHEECNPNAITPERIQLLEDIGFRWSTAKEFSNNTKNSSNSNSSLLNASAKKNKISRGGIMKNKSSCRPVMMIMSSPDDSDLSTNSSGTADAPTVISNSSTSSSSSLNVVPQVKRNASPLELLSMVAAASEARNDNIHSNDNGNGSRSNVHGISNGATTVQVVPSNTSAFTARMQQSSSSMAMTTQQHQHHHRIVYTAAAAHALPHPASSTGGPVLIQQVAAHAHPRYAEYCHSLYHPGHHPVAHHHMQQQQQQVVRVVHHHHYREVPPPASAAAVPMHHLSSAAMARHPIHY